MNFHPYSEIFPLLEGGALDELTADIKANGLREKIWLYDGKILDGRNRFLACQKAKVKADTRKYTGKDPLSFVVSLNVQRRHLTESQRAMAAARVATLRDGQRSDEVSGVPIGTAATTLNVGVRSVKRARKVIDEGSKALQQAVDSGEISVSKAAAVVDLPKAAQLAAARKKAAPAATPIPAENWQPDEDEEAKAELFERNHAASVDKILAADDRLATATDEIKRLNASVATLTISRNGYQNQCGELIRRIKALQRENERLKRQAA